MTRNSRNMMKRIGQKLTAPSPRVTGHDKQRQAQLVAALLLSLIGLGFCVSFIGELGRSTGQAFHNSEFYITTTITVLLIPVYALSRTRHYQWSTISLIALSSIGTFIVAILDNGHTAETGVFAYLVLPLVLSSFFLTLRSTSILAGAQILGWFVFTQIFESPANLEMLGFQLMLATVILYGTHYRNVFEQDRQSDLRDAEERYRQLVELAPFTIAVQQHGKIAYINPAGINMLGGTTMTDFCGQPTINFVHPDYLDAAQKRIVQTSDTSRPSVIVEEKLIGLDGRIVEVETTALPLLFDGKPATQIIVRDLTGQRRAEAKQRASETQYHDLVQNLPFAIIRTTPGPHGTCIVQNPACLRMFGVESEDEFQAIPVSNFYVNPADRQAYSDRLLAEGHIDREEVQFQRANGALFWGSVTAQAIRDETGAVAYFDAVIEDITLRKEAAAAIQRNDAHLRALLSAIPDIIFQLNRAGIFTNYHAPDHNLLVPPQDFIGKSMREVLPDLAEQTHEYIARALATGDMQSYEYSVLADDGEPRYYEARMSPYTDDEVVVVVRDITAWKRLTESLRHERDLVARITETSPIAITTVSKEGRIIFANQRAEELLGLKKDAITQLTYNDPEWRITDYEGHPLPEEHLPFARVMTTRKHVYEIGHGIEWPNGRRVLLAINGAPIKNDAGEIEEVVFSLEDVTERFAVEQTMRVSEERYHNLFDNTLVGFAVHEIITDEVGKPIDYRFLELNRRFEQLTGLRAEDVIGRCITDIMLTTDSTYIERYGQVALTGEPTRFTDYFEPLDRYYDIAAFSPRNGQFATLFLDITDRVKAQAELADSEDRYRSLFDGINDIVLVHDLEGHILDVNDAACRRLEYSRAELMRMTLAQIDEPGTYADEFQERLQHQLATGALSGIQGAHITKSGRRIAIDANTKVINYKGQQAVLAVSRDVTERNRTETLLRLQHDLITKLAAINDLETALNQVIDSIIGIDEIDNAAIYLIDPTTDTADMVYQRGLSPEYAAHVAHPERDSPQAQKVLQGQPVFCPYRDYLPELDTMRQSQGLQAFGLLPIQHDQQIIAALVVASHVYETFSPQVQHSLQAIAAQTGTFLVRIQTETALRRNEATLQSILRAAPVGLGMITNRTFGWINERFEDLIGYTAQEVAGQSARMIYESQHEYERVGQVKYGQIKAGAPVGTVETRLVHKDGSIADVLLSSSPVDPGDLAQGLITAAMDITERKRIEETLYFVGQQSWQGEESETFNAIVRFLGETLGIAVVMIGELVGNELEQVQSIALYKQGQTGETLTYPLPGTPCHNVVCQGTCVYPERVQTHFPEDQLLIDMGAASYAGTPLRDASGETLGILIAVDTKPMEKPNLIDSILQIVGARVAHEINRRRDARALQTSEARYRGVVETQTEFVVRCKPDGTRTFINDAYCRYFNQPREQLISKKFATVVPATDWSAIQEKFTRLTPEKPAETGIHRVIKPDGQIAWHEWVDQGIFDDAGQLVEIQSVGRDVTERVRIANELRQERDRAQQYLDIAGVILVALDTEGHITLINHKGREILGYSEAELLGQNWFERCLPPAEIETVSAFFKQAITGAAALPDHYQNTIQTRAGEIRLIAWHNTTLFDDTGQITGTLSSGEDITERERARRNIIESEARYSALINASPNSIMVVQNENYTFANPTAAQMLGYNTPEEVIGLPALPTIAPTSRDLVRTRAARAQQGQFNPPIELDVLRPDGTTLTIESTSVPITLQDEPATLIIGQDISERKAAEATLRYHSTILTSLSDAVISTDLAFVIQSWNEAAEKLYGWSAADTIGQPLNQIIPTIYTDENQTEEAIIEQFMHDGFWRGEVIQSDQNGTPLYILSATSLIKDEAGQPTGVVTVNRDITDRKLAEEAERAARALSDALRDTAAALTQSLDKEEVLERILIHLRQVIPHDAASIMLVSGQTATPVRQQGYEKFNAAEIFEHFRLTPHEYPAFTEIFNTKQVQIIPDTQADPRWQYIPETEWIRSHITVPILINDEVIGIINLDSATPHAFTLDQAERTNIFADQAAVAIQNATLYAEVQQHVAQLQALHAIMLDVSGEIELNTLLDKLVKNALTLIRAQAGGIYFYRPDQDVLEWTVQVGDPAAMAPIGTKLQRGEGLAGKVWETREPIIVDDYSQWAGRLPQYDNLHFTAVIGVPIIWDRQLLGVFNAVADKPERTFSERDAQLLRLFVNQAAIAIQKARMFDELEKRVRERTTDLSIRNQIANTLSSSLDHTVILANVLKTIVDQINVSGGAIYLLTKGDQPAFTLAAAYHLADEALRWIADILPRGTRLTTNNKRSFATIDMPYNGSLAAVLRVPIWRQDQIEGLIILVSQHTRPWRNADTIMLDAIGRQIAVALHNARLYTQALRDEARIRTILQSVADGLLVFNQDGELILMNPAAEALFAFYPAERGGAFSAARRLWQWLHAQDSPQTIEFVLPIMPLTYTTEQINQQCLEQHCAFKPDDSDLAWPCWLIPNGPDAQSLRQCPVYENTPTRSLQANNAEVRDTDDHILGQVIALRDVTYFRELDDLKGMFVSTVSHELRTPLSVVLLQVSTLLRYYDRISDDERRRMVGEIQAQAHILRDLIEDILELSRFDARRSQPDKQWFDLVAHCHEVVESLSPAIEQKELDVDLSRCTGLHYIHADMNQIMRVLRNLVGNAVKYTPAGGRIALALSETGGMMRLDVSDTGIGIEPEEQARVFDRFFRAETAAHIAPGTGLGLSITREIVELHGGSIHLVSEPDRGSTFTVLLPIDREE